jgi:hypothetical protein
MRRAVLFLVAGTVGGGFAGWQASALASSTARLEAGYDAAFIEQVEALKALQSGALDAYKMRLAMTLREQVARLQSSPDELLRHSEQVRQRVQYLCEHSADQSTGAVASPFSGRAAPCGAK